MMVEEKIEETQLDATLNNTVTSYNKTAFIEQKNYKVLSEKLNLSFDVNVHDETLNSYQRCFILTVHDLGSDSSQFEEFIMKPQMDGIRTRVVWINVNLPGQELDSIDLRIKKYPSLEELGEELINVVEFFKIPQVICMGEGAGANICSHFAIKYPNKCLGLILVEPFSSQAGFFESIKYKIQSLNLGQKEKAQTLINNISLQSTDNESFQNNLITDSNKKSNENRPNKNLTLFAESVFNRSCLLDKISEIKVDVLTVAAKNKLGFGETKKFFRGLQESRRLTPGKMVNSPFLEVENVSNVLKESTDSLATSIQFFIQGIGLLSAMPMKNSLVGMGTPNHIKYARSMSMEEADRPRSSSQSDTTSHLVSSNPSLNLSD